MPTSSRTPATSCHQSAPRHPVQRLKPIAKAASRELDLLRMSTRFRTSIDRGAVHSRPSNTGIPFRGAGFLSGGILGGIGENHIRYLHYFQRLRLLTRVPPSHQIPICTGLVRSQQHCDGSACSQRICATHFCPIPCDAPLLGSRWGQQAYFKKWHPRSF